MPDKIFLETYPLYKPFTYKLPEHIGMIKLPAIVRWCNECQSDQTYTWVSGLDAFAAAMMGKNDSTMTAGRTLVFSYRCAACPHHKRPKFSEVFYLLKFSESLDSVTKVGQNPAWDVSGDKNLEKLLAAHRVYLRRGMICESQGYGIAAFAYYRRITEEVIDKLLADLSDIIPDADKATYNAAYENTKTTRQTSDKIDLVKDLLPVGMIAEGMNPLGILHSALSEGLHAESDEDCLDYAATIREALVYLSGQISETKSQQRQFTDRMHSLLRKKSKG